MSIPLADAIFWIAVACCAVAQAAILRSVLKSPSMVAGSATATAAGADNSARRAVDIAWAILPGAALVVVFIYTWTAIHAPTAPATTALPAIIP